MVDLAKGAELAVKGFAADTEENTPLEEDYNGPLEVIGLVTKQARALERAYIAAIDHDPV